MYNSNQVQAMIAKYKLENNIEALIRLGGKYPPFQDPIGDLILSLTKRADKVNDRLKQAGLAEEQI